MSRQTAAHVKVMMHHRDVRTPHSPAAEAAVRIDTWAIVTIERVAEKSARPSVFSPDIKYNVEESDT